MRTNRFLVLVLVVLSTRLFALNPVKEYRITLQQIGLIGKELNIQTPDSMVLKAWFFPAQQKITQDLFMDYYNNPRMREYYAKENMPTVIICNGDWGNMSYLTNYVYELISENFNVVLFDWRGFGQSSDWEIDKDMLVLTEFLIDYQSVITYIKEMGEVDQNKIGLFGFSTGAYLSFIMATRNKSVKAMALRGIITSFEEVLPILHSISQGKNIIVPDDFPQNELPFNSSDKSFADLFLVVGEKDNRTPVWMSKKILDKYSGNKQLLIVPDAEHGGVKAPEWVYKSFFKEVSDFYVSAF
ncbi:MAG: alpha/beta fold hydrolase [Draconibacterium sp.]|nr:alpha/beta fold hydrolase [Draconibacterium sp.]